MFGQIKLFEVINQEFKVQGTKYQFWELLQGSREGLKLRVFVHAYAVLALSLLC